MCVAMMHVLIYISLQAMYYTNFVLSIISVWTGAHAKYTCKVVFLQAWLLCLVVLPRRLSAEPSLIRERPRRPWSGSLWAWPTVCSSYAAQLYVVQLCLCLACLLFPYTTRSNLFEKRPTYASGAFRRKHVEEPPRVSMGLGRLFALLDSRILPARGGHADLLYCSLLIRAADLGPTVQATDRLQTAQRSEG